MRQLWQILLGAAGLALAAGCATSGGDPGDRTNPQPWNTPAGWEGSGFGVPY
ncbi:MAG: hypothetical protein WC789_12865 [Lentisphaeria bacterium]|jgi:hypothetical protein